MGCFCYTTARKAPPQNLTVRPPGVGVEITCLTRHSDATSAGTSPYAPGYQSTWRSSEAPCSGAPLAGTLVSGALGPTVVPCLQGTPSHLPSTARVQRQPRWDSNQVGMAGMPLDRPL